ncbi:polysaccharide synthase [Xylaria venustula]|nr:polysaccharide synthase [Xylaria venustula]
MLIIYYQISFITLWFYRYVRLIVNCASSWTFKSVPPPDNPIYTSNDVTILIPTICREDQYDDFKLCLQSVLATKPHGVLVSTVKSDLLRITELAHNIDSRIQVMAASFANKRQQIYEAVPRIKTKITILADDDVVWPPTLLPQTTQLVQPGLGIINRIWEYLGACYIQRRNFEIAATSHIDGGISCLSGRTAAYRREFLQSEDCMEGYVNERWGGKLLNTDDDNYLTRLLVAKGWGIRIQMSKEAEVLTTLECTWDFLQQCLRWARSNWRSNYLSMVIERHIWKQQPWSSYTLHLATISHSLWNDLSLLYLLHRSTITWDPSHRLLSFCIFGLWLLFTKVVKLIPHFALYPGDIFLLPVTFCFGYFHGLIKLYALVTLNRTTWGGRQIPNGMGENARVEKPLRQLKRCF